MLLATRSRMPIKRKVLANLLTGVLGLSDTSSSCSPYPMAEKNSFASLCGDVPFERDCSKMYWVNFWISALEKDLSFASAGSKTACAVSLASRADCSLSGREFP